MSLACLAFAFALGNDIESISLSFGTSWTLLACRETLVTTVEPLSLEARMRLAMTIFTHLNCAIKTSD